MSAVTASATRDARPADSLRWIKADLHLHTAEDPLDEIDYTAADLLTRAHEREFRVLAITLHGKVFDDPAIFAQADRLGILLIRAAEMRVEGADVVLLNVEAQEAAGLQSFADLRRLRQRRGRSLLVFAPHPFYRFGGSIGGRLEGLVDCFDAIEHCHFHVPLFDPNAAAIRLAEKTHTPLLATSDAHRLRFFGDHYSQLGLPGTKGPLTVEDVFAAVRADRIRRVSPKGGLLRFASLMLFVFLIHPFLTLLPGSKRRRSRRQRRGVGSRSEAPPHQAVA